MIEIKITAEDLKTGRIKRFAYRLPEGTTFNTGAIVKNQERLDDTEYEIIEQEVRGS
ncbi:MAG: hypothetical protein KAR42_15240 [candidate division Zixibacteria bacterium]|nr:hypothetical protein [candidate division Zixibacteria bacterium]